VMHFTFLIKETFIGTSHFHREGGLFFPNKYKLNQTGLTPKLQA